MVDESNIYYQDNRVTIYHRNTKKDIMNPKKKIIIIPVIHATPPIETVEAVKKADKPRITIIYPKCKEL